ncbi:unnamed protein product [Protopolystoma xenopodis]|uniref:Uncharacterized protein n=1 Tax=Protopolystoma xenopodis TaxID=117903 RepID=A0A448XI00_9PLAT|nr:unnamed protein product [Protopolystoma xenopodis]
MPTMMQNKHLEIYEVNGPMLEIILYIMSIHASHFLSSADNSAQNVEFFTRVGYPDLNPVLPAASLPYVCDAVNEANGGQLVCQPDCRVLADRAGSHVVTTRAGIIGNAVLFGYRRRKTPGWIDAFSSIIDYGLDPACFREHTSQPYSPGNSLLA